MSQQHGPADTLGEAYTAFATDLATTLDLEMGVAAATEPTVYTTDLAGLLDLESGLAAILNGGPVSPDGRTVEPLSAAGGCDGTSNPAMGAPARDLGMLDAACRLRMRTQPSYMQMRSALQLVCDLTRCRTDARGSLVRVVILAQANARRVSMAFLHHNVDDGHRTVSQLAGARALAIDRGLGTDLISAITTSLDHAIALDRGLRRVATTTALLHASDQALLEARSSAHDLAETLSQAITHASAEVSARSRDLNIDLLANRLNVTADSHRALLEQVADVGDNFIGADLRAARIQDVADLNGIRWSSSTSWPTQWANRIRAISIEIESGIFQISGDAGKRSLARVES